MLFLCRLALLLALALGVQPVLAGQPAASGDAGAKPGEMQMSTVTLTVIIKDAFIALQHANMTGNYSVLRDMGTPVFRENFDQAALAAAFANLRARKIDLSPAYYLSPNLTKRPELTARQRLPLQPQPPAFLPPARSRRKHPRSPKADLPPFLRCRRTARAWPPARRASPGCTVGCAVNPS